MSPNARELLGWLSECWRFESLSILTGDDGFVRGLVLRETASFVVPTEVFAGESGGFHSEQAGLCDAPTDGERSPQMLLRPKAVVGPILPMVVWFDFWKVFVFRLLSFSEDAESSVGFKQEGTFFADDEGLVCAGFDGGQAKRRK